MEQSFILIKPDAVHRCLVGDIISAYERKGFKLVGLKSIILSDEQFYFLYSEIAEKPFHMQFKHVMQSGPCVLLVVSGHQAVRSAFSLAGSFSSPEDDTTASIRQRYSIWTGADVIHRADDNEMAQTQIDYFFNHGDLHNYVHLHEVFMSKGGYTASAHTLGGSSVALTAED